MCTPHIKQFLPNEIDQAAKCEVALGEMLVIAYDPIPNKLKMFVL
jgi:hypothetical protein